MPMSKILRVAHFLILSMLLLFLLASCRDKSQDTTIPQYLTRISITSFHEVFPILYAEAKEWDTGAGLTQGVIYITPQAELNFRRVGSFFDSPNKDTEFVFVEQLNNGIVSSRHGEYPLAMREFNFIEPSNILDSVEAWNILLTNPQILAFDETFFECSCLRLKHHIVEKENVLVWQLELADCEYSEQVFLYIDARTGEHIETGK